MNNTFIGLVLLPGVLRERRAAAFAAGSWASGPVLRRRGLHQVSMVMATGTGLRMISSTGEVFCTCSLSASRCSGSRRFAGGTSPACRGSPAGPRPIDRETRAGRSRLPGEGSAPRSGSRVRRRCRRTRSARQEASPASTISTAFGPASAPSSTGGSSPSSTKGAPRLVSSLSAPWKPWIRVWLCPPFFQSVSTRNLKSARPGAALMAATVASNLPTSTPLTAGVETRSSGASFHGSGHVSDQPGSADRAPPTGRPTSPGAGPPRQPKGG